jgi:hypothetical protein
MPNYVAAGYVVTGYVEAEVAAEQPELRHTLVLAAREQGGATAVGSPALVILDEAPRPFPDVFVVLHTPGGVRLFSERLVPDDIAVQETELGRFSSLLAISPLDFRTVPIGDDLIASLGASEQVSHRLVVRNDHPVWSQLLAQEPVLCQPLGEYVDFGGPYVELVLRAAVSHVILTKATVEIELEEP